MSAFSASVGRTHNARASLRGLLAKATPRRAGLRGIALKDTQQPDELPDGNAG